MPLSRISHLDVRMIVASAGIAAAGPFLDAPLAEEFQLIGQTAMFGTLVRRALVAKKARRRDSGQSHGPRQPEVPRTTSATPAPRRRSRAPARARRGHSLTRRCSH